MIGTHNSLTYLPVKHWWKKPFNFIAKCQNKDIIIQVSEGVTIFDFRFRFDNDHNIVFAHGSMEYDLNKDAFLNILSYLNSINTKKIYVRIIYESSFFDKYIDTSFKENMFIDLCNMIQSAYTNIIFFGGNRKYDWKVLYDFKTKAPTFRDAYSSVECKWLSWWPWLYAKYINRKINKAEYINSNDNILMDFI